MWEKKRIPLTQQGQAQQIRLGLKSQESMGLMKRMGKVDKVEEYGSDEEDG